MRKRAALEEIDPVDILIDELERVNASIRAKVGHPFRVIKRQFGHVKVRNRGRKKNTAQLHTLFALSNLWMARKALMKARRPECACKRPKGRQTGSRRDKTRRKAGKTCQAARHAGISTAQVICAELP